MSATMGELSAIWRGAVDDYRVPYRVFHHLLTGFVCDEGRDLASDYKKGEVAHPGDPFGRVFAWLWDLDRDIATHLVADLLAEARRAAKKGQDEVRFSDLLDGLHFALPTHLAHHEQYATVRGYLEAEVPKRYGREPDA